MAESFASFEEEFLRFTSEIVWCTVTTVDAKGRPRSRVLHPIWQVIDGLPVGWVVTSKTPVKAGHLAGNPHLACSYWSPAQNTVAIDCVASWVEDQAGKQHVWDLFMTTPPPLGYDLSGYGPEGLRNALFNPLRLDPWRVQIQRFEGWGEIRVPQIWRAGESG
jgi:general stress protein 26